MTLSRLALTHLAVAALGLLTAGCYTAHSNPLEPPPPFGVDAGPGADAGARTACGCLAGEVCMFTCAGGRLCVDEPERRPCALSRAGCYVSDPCGGAGRYGVSMGTPLPGGELFCACVGEPVPPSDTNCGGTNCASDEVCVEACDAFAPYCVPRGDAPCADSCGCFDDVDVCPDGACGAVGPDGHVICDCDGGGLSDCERWLEGDPNTSCDPATYGECSAPIEGVPCCSRASYCDQGRIVESSLCTDDCAQSCGLVTQALDCQALGCEWFVPQGCFEDGGDELVTSPRCHSDDVPCTPGADDCSGERRCLGFPYDPCAGSPCDACLGVDYFCAVP